MKNVSLDNGAKNPHDKKSFTNPIVDKNKKIDVILTIWEMTKSINIQSGYHQENNF